jgi:hypothetical protein
MPAVPARARLELERRLEAHIKQRWPELGELQLRFRGTYAYVEAAMPDGYDQPLFRLEWKGRPDTWGFAVWLASKDGYEKSVLPSGAFVGTPEEAMNCACGLYLGDASAWSELPVQRSAPRH